MSHIQAVLFDRRYYSYDRAIEALDRMDINWKKEHTTPHYYRFRIRTPNYNVYEYRIKEIKKGIKFIFGFQKTR